MNYWEGERIRLRAIEPGDAVFFFELQRASERTRLLDFIHPRSHGRRSRRGLWNRASGSFMTTSSGL